MPRAPFPLALVAAACLGAGDAGAIGIGGVQAPVVLGQPLDVTVPVQLADGETLDAGCVVADVHVGETRLGPDQVATMVSRPVGAASALVRVRSRMGIDEPVVSLTLAAGCPVRVTRRFVLFADPPELQAARPIAPDPVTSAPAVVDAEVVAASAPASAATMPDTPQDAGMPAATRLPASTPPAARGTKTSKPTRAAAAARPGANPPPPLARAKPAPRLQLELMELRSPTEDARLLAAQEAARVAEAAASAARQQAADAEAELARLRSATAADRAALVNLRARMAEAEAQAGWMQVLVAVMAAGLGILSWRLWRRRHRARPAWWSATQAPVAPAPQPSGDDDESWRDQPLAAVRPPTPAATLEPLEQHVPVAASLPVSAEQTQVPAAAWVVVPAAPRDGPAVARTIGSPVPSSGTPAELVAPEPATARRHPRAAEWALDEDADMEQRADFFVVLGLDDDAADLLRTHLERTGGRSAMAHLKLLEIHRRRGDRVAYERTAERFSQHFNARPPAWDDDARTGGGLDEAPALIAAIERRWHDPREAVDWLESLLWRRADGAPTLSLAAFEDALLLCQVALRRQQPDVARVAAGAATADGRTAATVADGAGPAFELLWDADEPADVERIELELERSDGAAAVRAPLVVR